MAQVRRYLVTQLMEAPIPHAVVWRGQSNAYAFGPLTTIEEAAKLYAELHDDRSKGVRDLGVVWHCRINPPFYLGRTKPTEQPDLEAGEYPPPLVKTSVRLNSRHGVVVDIFSGNDTGADVIGPFPDYGEAAEWWDRQRRWFKPSTRAMAMSLATP